MEAVLARASLNIGTGLLNEPRRCGIELTVCNAMVEIEAGQVVVQQTNSDAVRLARGQCCFRSFEKAPCYWIARVRVLRRIIYAERRFCERAVASRFTLPQHIDRKVCNRLQRFW